MSERNSKVTTHIAYDAESSVMSVDTIYSNYAQAYSSWDSGYEEECPECYGTGLDRDEIYDCVFCYGEGVIVYDSDPDADTPDLPRNDGVDTADPTMVS